jgi:hypothetical protein
VYYINIDHLIQHVVRTSNGSWSKGPLSDLMIPAAPGAGLAASVVVPPGPDPAPELYLYYQGAYLPSRDVIRLLKLPADAKTYVIKEASKTGTEAWKISTALNLRNGLANTSLAAVAYWSENESKRFFYYQ